MFSTPWLLLLLLPLAGWLWLAWKKHGQPVAVPFDHASPPARIWTSRLLRLAGVLPVLILAVVVCILAGPRRLGEPKTRRMLTNIEFVVDVSGSMLSKFGSEGNRYDAAMQAITGFVDQRPGDAFGLMVFGDAVLEWVPLTSDPSAIKQATPFLSPDSLPPWFPGGTSIGMALEHALKVMTARPEGDRMIVLLTDGQSYDLSNGNDTVVANKLLAEGIQVYTIHIAEDDPGTEVTNISRITGGEMFEVADPATIPQVIKHIDDMKKARLERISAENMDHFGPWGIAGGVLLLGLFVSLCGFRPTPW